MFKEWVVNQLIPNYSHLNKTVEVTRVNLFNIITQCRAIFNVAQHSLFASFPANQPKRNFFDLDQRQNLLQTVEHDLAQGVSTTDFILVQCMCKLARGFETSVDEAITKLKAKDPL